MRRSLLALPALLAVLLPGTPAWAHTALLSSIPARDAALTKAPATVSLTFSQRLNPDFTTIVVSDAAKQRVPASPPAVDRTTGTVTFSRALTNGTYTVAYRVVSADGHTVQGSYAFTVTDPAQPSADALAATSAAATAAPGSGSGSGSGGTPVGVLIGLGAGGALLAAVAVFLYFSGRRRAAVQS